MVDLDLNAYYTKWTNRQIRQGGDFDGDGESDDIGEVHSELPSENPSATAVAFVPELINECYALAVGLESGEVLIWKYSSEEKWL